MTLLSILSYFIAKDRGEDPKRIILEHVIITLIAIGISHLVGDIIVEVFN